MPELSPIPDNYKSVGMDVGRMSTDTAGHVKGLKGPDGALVHMPVVWAQSAVPVSVTGTTAETTLASITIPGGMMGPNGALRIMPLWSCTNNANNKYLRVRLGGTLILNRGETTTTSESNFIVIRNRGNLASQVSAASFNDIGLGVSSGALITTNLDTSVDQVLTFAGQLGTSTDTITLEGYTVEVLPG